MTSLSQSQRDEVLLEANHGGKMKKRELRQRLISRLSELDPILEELEKEGQIKMTVGRHEDLVSLKE